MIQESAATGGPTHAQGSHSVAGGQTGHRPPIAVERFEALAGERVEDLGGYQDHGILRESGDSGPSLPQETLGKSHPHINVDLRFHPHHGIVGQGMQTVG